MTLVNTETGELVEPMSADSARRLTERIRIAASNYTEAKAKVLALVDEAKAGSAHLALGYKSWTAYLSDVLSDEPLRLAREDRRDLVVKLTDEGMTTRAIAPIVGADQKTIVNDLRAAEEFSSAPTNPVVRTTTGLDGRERTTATAGQTRSGEPVAAGSTERAHQEAELVNAFGSIVRRSLTPKNVATLTPKARARLISILNDALNTLQETSS
jgi:hypothetical protein